MSVQAPPSKPSFKYLELTGLNVQSVANGTITEVIDATMHEFAFDATATGAALSAVIQLIAQLPNDFKKFAGKSDDLTIKAYQSVDSGDGVGDLAVTVDVLDGSGADADDDTVDDIALTGSPVSLDCAITGGTFQKGDFIIIKLTIAEKSGDANEATDAGRVSLPKIKYIPE